MVQGLKSGRYERYLNNGTKRYVALDVETTGHAFGEMTESLKLEPLL